MVQHRGRAATVLLACALLWSCTRKSSVEQNPSDELAFLGGKHKAVVAKVQTAFPGAMKGSAVFSKMQRALEEYSVARNNVIYATSICPDETTGDEGHLTTILKNFYGHSFPMGGLGGVPFVGKTGFFAFSHHVPDDGHVVVAFGPHIGYTPDGESAKFLRKGQAAVSTCCGALNAAFAQINSGANFPPDERDTQQAWLREKVRGHFSAIQAAKDPMVEMVMKVYQDIEDEVMAIINTGYGEGNLVLIGGITINMPYPTPGYFLPLHFSVRSDSMEPVDLMDTLA